MLTTEIAVDGIRHCLAGDQDVEALKALMEEAVDAGGRFVELHLVGGVAVSVLITRLSRVVFSSESTDDIEVDVPGGDAALRAPFDS
jgi:hypothetical protein